MSQPGVIDSLQFAREGGELHGVLGMDWAPRLVEMACKTAGIEYFLRGKLSSSGVPCLQIKASGSIETVCQRCLMPLALDLAVDIELQLCEDPKVIATAEDDIDRLLADKALHVAQVIEDEVILSIPQVPKHDDCGGREVTARLKGSSPFESLKAFKLRGGD